MILLDVDVVFPLLADGHANHVAARRWFADLQRAGELFGFPATVLHSHLRLVTNRTILDPPASIDQAFTAIDAIVRHDRFRWIEPGARHLHLLRQMCEAGGASRNLVNDAALAAIAVEHGASVASFDHDFRRFPNLLVVVPGE